MFWFRFGLLLLMTLSLALDGACLVHIVLPVVLLVSAKYVSRSWCVYKWCLFVSVRGDKDTCLSILVCLLKGNGADS